MSFAGKRIGVEMASEIMVRNIRTKWVKFPTPRSNNPIAELAFRLNDEKAKV